MPSTFAQRMAEAVRDSELSVRRIADLAKTSPGQVSQWQTEGRVKAENIKADVLERICQVLNIRPRWLLYNELPKRRPAGFTGDEREVCSTSGNYTSAPLNAYWSAAPATRAAIDILLLPEPDRETVCRDFPHLVTGVSLMEEWALGAIAARKTA